MKDIINRYKMYLIGGILLLLALALFLIFNKNDSVEASPIKEEQLEKKEELKEEVKEEMVIYVDI